MTQNFIDTIKARGFVHQMTDEDGLRALLQTPGQRAYIGFDCTAPSLHVGSLLQIMLLRWWQKCGHTPIVLLGGGTTKIGDPSGKDEARPPITDTQITENMAGLKQVFSTFLSFSNNESATPDNAAIFVNNNDWFKNLEYVEFLREIGRHFSVNRMLSMDSVRLRLDREQPLSFLEFNYMILQAYDFVELNKRHSCRVQMGGSDQWGSIVQGIELNRRLSEGKANEIYGITTPLIASASGAKMGKTAAGAVWLNADLLSPYDYWQFWRNTEDGDVVRFLKLFTEIPLDEIADLGAREGAGINDAKIRLATEATALLHGSDAAERAAQTARETFSGVGISEHLPEMFVDLTALKEGIAVYALLVQAELASSNGEARRLIKGGGVRVNDIAVTIEDARLTQGDFAEGFVKLSKGKKQHVLVKVS